MLKGSLGGKEGRRWNWRLEALKTIFSLLCFLILTLTDHQRVPKWMAVDGSGMGEREDGFRREGKWGKQRLGQWQPWREHQGCAGGG